MIKIGCSIYTGLKDYTEESNLLYLKAVKEMGYQIIFSSAHINEATISLSELDKLVSLCDEANIKVSLDVSKPMMTRFSIPKDLNALRLDFGFTKEEIVSFSQNLGKMVELNASTIKEEYFLDLINMGLNLKNVRMSFNFYPKLYTAHSREFVIERLEFFKKFNVPTLAFIPSKKGKRPPMYEGLPTIEEHRFMDLDLAIEDLKAMGVDEIAFGDAYASDDELKLLKHHQTEHIILPFTFVNGGEAFIDNLRGIFSIRPDFNDLLLRSTSNRGKADIEPFNQVERKLGYVTIDNNKFLRYKGEVNICLTDLPKDERVNVIGFVNLTPSIINALKKGQKFSFGDLFNESN